MSNFSVLGQHDEQLLRLGMLAEKYFADDPNTCLIKLRQLTEALAQLLAARAGLFLTAEESQYELLRRLRDSGVLPNEIYQIFGEVRRTGNNAAHALSGDRRTALAMLKLSWQLGLWFHRTFKDPHFKSGPFTPPQAPADKSEELQADLAKLAAELEAYRAANTQAAEKLSTLEAALSESKDEQSFWESVAAEEEGQKVKLAARLAELQLVAKEKATETLVSVKKAAASAVSSLHLDEAETRKLIDDQLRQAGWEADTNQLKYGQGTRPEKGRNIAIAEWPTETGPADYVLFVGLTPMAVVEAKRKNVDVSSHLQQAKRYSRGFQPSGETAMHEENWGNNGEFRIPFVFSTNGRPFLQQLKTKSGIWFCDLRSPSNLGRPLDGWHTPEGLAELFKRDDAKAHAELASTPLEFTFQLRDYQKKAILAAESAIEAGQREMLVAMATGTGKTKTCIALIYRLLNAQRFRRILFLVDRTALGEQAADDFKSTRMVGLQTFADTFNIKELDEISPDTATKLHLATIQGMVQRLLYAPEDAVLPAVDQYDCIVVDECHRGYLLDRELSETEMVFRGYEDYISKYRRVLDYFDACKIGLTATPALHTTEIFGAPIFTYGYREAVIDGHLVDYEPPIQIKTDLSTNGITWKAGEAVKVYDARKNQIDLYKTPDEIKAGVEDFNRKVITEPFNRVVCEYLAKELDPSSRQKTLIFCATDAHADLVVDLLKKSFEAQYGSVDDDAVIKITGAADKPLSLILRYKNERLPNVAVTVDLLTTGIDVPEICNLVFLRQVGSRILFDQMLGRATRLCDFDGTGDKETFRVYDAVKMFESVGDMTEMKPVVVNPKISFAQLTQELGSVTDDDARKLVRDQFLAKLQAKKRHLSDEAKQDFETKAGMSAEAFIQKLKAMPLAEIAAWFTANPDLGEILDRKRESSGQPQFISDHEDSFQGTERGYGKGKKPEDYLQEFTVFIKSHSNDIPALMTALTRPRELTRKQLRELALELDKAGFSEAGLATAWRERTNQEIAARIVGYIRQAAIGDALLPYAERVDHALQKILASRNWSGPQRDWLKRIAAQTKANQLVDRDALDDPDLVFRREGGGFNRLDKIFNGELSQILESFNDSLWQAA